MKIYTISFIVILIPLIFSDYLISQSLQRCPCRKVETELLPDSSILLNNLKILEINTSYISWNDFLTLGGEEYPEDDEISEEPHNFHTNCFGCSNSKVYDKKSKQLFTGEIYFTGDDEKMFKNVPLQIIQINNGLKNGFEVHYNVNSEHNCYYPRLIAYMKNGQPHKKLYEFEFIDNKLKIRNEESYEEGLLYGITKTYDNYSKNGHQLVYEANIIKFPSRECCYMDHSEGNGLSSSFPVNNEDYQFEGQRIQYFGNSGKIAWKEFWSKGKLQFRRSYYEINDKTCKLKEEFPYEITNYKYSSEYEFIEESIKYFSDCNSSIEEISSTKNFLPFGKYEKYSKPSQLLEKGIYDDNGLKQGLWVKYSEKGIILERTNYEMGMINGIQELFNEKGILFRRLRFKEDKIIEILK
jgi:antitoxin component YwqK of YwqJK toxin-antitoxin module